ncbi:MAG: methylenetetrahydrofolate reductase [Alphaproteobacteria bacterium]
MLKLSTEFFPLTSPLPLERLSRTWEELKAAGVSEYSLTFGAMGSAQDKSTTCLKYIRVFDRKTSPVMHLTCRGQTWKSLERLLQRWKRLGITRVLALRGDAFRPRNDGPNSSVELVQFLTEFGMKSSVAAYPDRHPDSRSEAEDNIWLERKLEAGADQIVTQFSARIEGVLRLRDFLDGISATAELKIGVMPVPDWDRFKTLLDRCGMQAEPGEALLFEGLPEDSHHALSLGLAYANMRALMAQGCSNFHLYGLNNTRLLLPLIQSLKSLEPTTTPMLLLGGNK